MLNLDKNMKYLLACSYGPDSMYLFSLLLNEGYNFGVAHVNYHFRKESDEEERKLREHCDKNNVPLFVYDNKELVTSNIEEKAREIRYSFFKSVYDREGYDVLLVAHHKDDHLETYLMQKQRKNLPLFYGINEKTTINGMVVIRPLLNIYKEDILKYDDDHHIPYSIDVTNLENTFLRNKIRNDLLKNYTREEKESLAREIDRENERLNSIKCKLNDNDINDVSFLSSLGDEELSYALTNLMRKELPDYECSSRFVSEIKKVCESKKPNVLIALKDDYYLMKEYDHLSIRKLTSFEPIIVNEPTVIDNDFFYFDLNKKDFLKYPLIVRPYQKGDTYLINDYSVSVRRLFIDWKMPIYLRKMWPLFIHDGKVIYIPRYQKDFDIKNDEYFYVKYAYKLKK